MIVAIHLMGWALATLFACIFGGLLGAATFSLVQCVQYLRCREFGDAALAAWLATVGIAVAALVVAAAAMVITQWPSAGQAAEPPAESGVAV